MQSQFGSLAVALSKVVDDGLTKAAQRAEGTAALLAAVLIAHADPKSDAALSSAHIWEKAGTADSPLLSPGQLSKAAVPDALTMVHLAEALLSQVCLPVSSSSKDCLAAISRVLSAASAEPGFGQCALSTETIALCKLHRIPPSHWSAL